MTVYPIKATFARGELSPRLHGRVDIEHYAMGLEKCENWFVLRQGGLRRRPGSVFAGEVKDSTKKTSLIPFEFSQTESYVIEMGSQYARFFALGGQVFDSGSPYEISHSYLEADLFDIHYAQSADVVYLSHGSYPAQQLTRTTETNWAFDNFQFFDGPYQTVDQRVGNVTLSDAGSLTPLMTSIVAPSGTVTTNGGGVNFAHRVFDRNVSTSANRGAQSGSIEYILDGSETKTVDAYSLSSHFLSGMVTDWSIQGYDGANWVVIEKRTGETGWAHNETRYFELDNTTAYRGYRLDWTGIQSGTTTYIGEISYHVKASEQDLINATFSDLTNVNSGAGFSSGDVGRPVKLVDGDGRLRWFEIDTIISANVVAGRLYGQTYYSDVPFSNWKLGVFSSDNGHPKTVGFFEERLFWGSSKKFPRRIWGSKSLSFNDHGTSDPIVDDDGIDISMTSKKINEITFIEEGQDLIVGTTGTMRTVGATSNSEPLTPVNASQRQQTNEGATNIQPITIGSTIIFADYYKKRLREFTYSFEINGYRSPELSILSDHIFDTGIKNMCYQGSPDNLIWVGLENGNFVSTTFERDQNIVGMTRHSTSNGEIEDMTSVSTQDGDRVWWIVKRTIGGVTRRYVEYLSESFEFDDVEDAVYLDSSITFTGSDFTTVTGLTHLEGEVVGILADGVDIGDATVSGGSITLPNGLTADKATVGLRYKSFGKTLRMSQAGNRDGTIMSRKVKVQEMSVDLMETGSLMCGTSKKKFEVVPRGASELIGSSKKLFTGFKSVDLQSGWDDGGQMEFETNSAYPATVRSIVAGVEGEP